MDSLTTCFWRSLESSSHQKGALVAARKSSRCSNASMRSLTRTMYCCMVSSLAGVSLVSGAGSIAPPVIEDKVLLWPSYIMGEWSDMLSLARLKSCLGADKGGVREGTELGEDVMRENLSMVDLVDRPARRTDWRLETDGAVTFSERPPLFLSLSGSVGGFGHPSGCKLCDSGACRDDNLLLLCYAFVGRNSAIAERWCRTGGVEWDLDLLAIFAPCNTRCIRVGHTSGHHLFGACGDDSLLLSHVAGSRTCFLACRGRRFDMIAWDV
jgi:hypothetical protein